MSLPFQIVFLMLVFEMSLFVLLIAPLPLSWRRGMVKWMSKSPIISQIQYVMNIAFIFVVMLFIDSLNRLRSSQEKDAEHHGHADALSDAHLHAKMFHAQRNIYLTGSVIFLSLVLNRFYNMIVELLKNEEKTEVLKQQAAKTSKEYLKLLDGDQERDKQIDELKEKLAAAEKAVKDVEIIKKQAAQTADEYMRLTDRYVALEKKLQYGSDSKKTI
ncbi:B-cell receptor-associated protein 31-like-domain-containing protein [Entophlyctis helioformis]|nr:B-cell receptor-associated protein 31-like-domain-containing protein [Entophlyctis helioformis]